MKFIVKIFLPLCIFSFIFFGISVWVLGVNHNAASHLSSTSGWTEEISTDFDTIDVDAPACAVRLMTHDKDFTTAKIQTGSGRNEPEIKVSGGTLKIQGSGTPFDVFGFFRDFFSGNNISGGYRSTVVVYVPEKTYESINIEVNAGEVSCEEIAAEKVYLGISAGKLNYIQPDIKAEYVGMDVSAGTLYAKNVNTEKYSIDVSAGSANVYDLTGQGNIDISAGNANVVYAELNGNVGVDVSAGDVVIGLPKDCNATVKCDKSAGTVTVRYMDYVKKSVSDGDKFTIGSGEYRIKTDLSAGSVTITEDFSVKQSNYSWGGFDDFTDYAEAVEEITTATSIHPSNRTEPVVEEIEERTITS